MLDEEITWARHQVQATEKVAEAVDDLRWAIVIIGCSIVIAIYLTA